MGSVLGIGLSKQAPFEPLAKANFQDLTPKTAFLITLATAGTVLKCML